MRRGVAAQDSLDMSALLLDDMAAGRKAEYGALVFDDPAIQAIPQAIWDLANATGLPVGLTGMLLAAITINKTLTAAEGGVYKDYAVP